MSLTTKIREYRVRDKLSQEELAQKVGGPAGDHRKPGEREI